MSPLRTSFVAAVVEFTLASALATALSAQAVVVPSDIQLPGTQPGQVAGLQDVSKCDNCHGGYDPLVEPAHGWRGGLMSQAARDPIFWASMAVAEQDFAGAGDLCLRCHTPDSWISGHSTPTDGSALQDSLADDGVSCDACHRMTDPDTSEWLGVQVAPFVAHDDAVPPEGWYGSGMLVLWASANEKAGPYADATPNHGALPSAFHRSAAFCGSCHDVSNSAVGDLAPGHGSMVPLEPGTYLGTPGGDVALKAAFNNPPYAYGALERTFSEHQASAWATLAMADYAGLPEELKDGSVERAFEAATAGTPDGDYADGTPRTYTCQTCHMRPTIGKGVNKPGAPTRADLPLHDQTGASTWLADALLWLDDRDRLVVAGGVSAGERAALADAQLRARENLQGAAALSVDGDVLRVVNLTGHKLPTGYPEGRRMWLRVTWSDEEGQVLRIDGEYGPLTVDIDGAPVSVQTLIDPDGEHTRLYAIHPAMSQAFAAQLLGLGYDPALALGYDRVTGEVEMTLAELAAAPPGASFPSFHFVLNDVIEDDTRIPPYGLGYDEGRVRSVLPVPTDQYGDPGPGGVYDHADTVLLDPPPGAVQATIELLYQSTSWEFIQFLDLANDGSVPFLASTGRDMLEAWLANGMSPPEVMATAEWGAEPDAWTELGFGLAGTTGEPELEGQGGLVGGTPYALLLTEAAGSATAWLVVGFDSLFAPFRGGVLVPDPSPPGFVLALSTDPAGQVSLTGTWPNGVPAGVDIFVQFWIQDAGAVAGLSASEALQGTTP